MTTTQATNRRTDVFGVTSTVDKLGAVAEFASDELASGGYVPIVPNDQEVAKRGSAVSYYPVSSRASPDVNGYYHVHVWPNKWTQNGGNALPVHEYLYKIMRGVHAWMARQRWGRCKDAIDAILDYLPFDVRMLTGTHPLQVIEYAR